MAHSDPASRLPVCPAIRLSAGQSSCGWVALISHIPKAAQGGKGGPLVRLPLRVCNSCLQRVIALRPSDILPACCRRDLNNLQASSATHIALSAVGVVQWQPHSRCKCSLSHVQHVVASETEAKHSKWVQSVIGRALSRVYRRASHLPLALFCQWLLLRCLSGFSIHLIDADEWGVPSHHRVLYCCHYKVSCCYL